MEFRILGDFELEADGRGVALGPAKQRILLAALLVDLGRTVSSDALIDCIWDGEALPGDPRNVLHTYVARVRRLLQVAHSRDEDQVLLRHNASGYQLVVD